MLSAFDIGLWNILFWIFVGLAIGGLISRLLGIRTATERDRIDLSRLVGHPVTIHDERIEVADELQAIEGVGPQIAEVFHENGIHRFHQIGDMTAEEISRLLKDSGARYELARPFTWPFQARLLAGGLISEHAALRERLTGGRLPLTSIKGLGPATAERLADLGVNSVETLAEEHATDLTAKLEASGTTVARNVIAGWIDHARAIKSGDLEHLAVYFGVTPTILHGRPAVTFTEKRDVSGPLVDVRSLEGLLGDATVTATARPSLLPFWIGLAGAILLGLLSALGLRGVHKPEIALPSMPKVALPGISALEAELGTDTTFETGSAVLTAAGKAEIDTKIIEPARDLDVASVKIVGHADVRGDDALNLKLSRDRAQSVATYMREKVKAENIKWNPRVIEVYGAGEEFPNPAANTAETCASLDPSTQQASDCYAPDRRVGVTILARGSNSEIDAARAASNGTD